MAKPTQKMFMEDGEDNKKNAVKEETPPAIPNGNVIDLPSKGKLGYPSSVSYRDILVKDEEVLSGVTQKTLLRTLNGTLKSILNDCEFFGKMSTNDRDFVLLWIWANTYSSKKYVDVKCSNVKCGHVEKMEIDLTKVPVMDVRDDIKAPLEIPIGDDKIIKVNPSTVDDEIMVESYLAGRDDFSELEMERLMMIASIDVGVSIPFDKKVKWVGENINSKVFGYVRRYHQYFKFGISDTVEYKCPKCEEVTSVVIPFQISDVFYPELPDDFERLL